MNSEIIAGIILSLSLVVMGIIIFRKIPLLLALPEVARQPFNWKDFFLKIKNLFPFKEFSFEIFLQKILSKIRVLTLKTDNKTSSWLQKLRQKAKEKKSEQNDDYWKDIRESTKQ